MNEPMIAACGGNIGLGNKAFRVAQALCRNGGFRPFRVSSPLGGPEFDGRMALDGPRAESSGSWPLCPMHVPPQHVQGEIEIDRSDEKLVNFRDEYGEAAQAVLVQALLERERYNPSASVPTLVREPARPPG